VSAFIALGGNPGGRTIYDENAGAWHNWAKVDEHHDANNLDGYLANEGQDKRFGIKKAT
jgi:hypothetical protein